MFNGILSACAITAVSGSLGGVAEVAARVLGSGTQLLLNAQDLVVLGEALGAARSARLDLPGGQPHHQVGDERVFGLSRPAGTYNS